MAAAASAQNSKLTGWPSRPLLAGTQEQTQERHPSSVSLGDAWMDPQGL